MATDNVVSTLGKVLQSHPESADGRMIAELWLHSLPIVNDMVEAKVVHAQLVTMVESGDVRVLGESNKNLPHVIDVFVQVQCGLCLWSVVVVAYSKYSITFHCPSATPILTGCVSCVPPRRKMQGDITLPKLFASK